MPRRDFIGSVSSAVSLSGTGFKAFSADPNRRQGLTASSWDDTWARGLAGEHKLLFDCTELELDGEGWLAPIAKLYRDYSDAAGVDPKSIRSVIVVRHGALPIVLNDAVWEKLELGERLGITDPATGKPSLRNPFVRQETNVLSSADLFPSTLRDFQSLGVVVLACAVAGLPFAHELGAGESDLETLGRSTISGVVLQPNGLYALVRAQDVGCILYRR